ncbi:hypothetical protein OIU78_013215 [Salix suchowensis]|nr:hypothetical protein OIU78_013215 [Salix suchowensis]
MSLILYRYIHMLVVKKFFGSQDAVLDSLMFILLEKYNVKAFMELHLFYGFIDLSLSVSSDIGFIRFLSQLLNSDLKPRLVRLSFFLASNLFRTKKIEETKEKKEDVEIYNRS